MNTSETQTYTIPGALIVIAPNDEAQQSALVVHGSPIAAHDEESRGSLRALADTMPAAKRVNIARNVAL